MIRAKFDTKVGQVLYPKGTVVKAATLKEAQRAFPNIEFSLDSRYCSVWFPNIFNWPCLMSKDQLIITDD